MYKKIEAVVAGPHGSDCNATVVSSILTGTNYYLLIFSFLRPGTEDKTPALGSATERVGNGVS